MLKFVAYALAAPLPVGEALAEVDLPGFDRSAVSAAHGPGLMAGSIWYPAGQAIYKTRVVHHVVLLAHPSIWPPKLPWAAIC